MNDTTFRRVEWGVATVPFPIGVWTPGKTFGVAGVPSELRPFGAPWPDGSVRYGQLSVALDLAPGAEKIVHVTQTSGTPSGPLSLSNWVASSLSNFGLDLVVGVPGRGLRTADLKLKQVLHSSRYSQTLYLRGRVPDTDLVCDLWVTARDGQDHMPFDLRVTSSKASSSKWVQAFDSIYLVARGAAVHIRGHVRRGVKIGPVSAQGPNAVQLMGADTFFDGQGQGWWGELLFYHPAGAASDPIRASTLMATLEEPLFGVSTDWASSGAFGPFGVIPPLPPWITDGGRASQIQRRREFVQYRDQPGGPWDDWPLGLRPNANTTGDQYDFGAVKLLNVFASGYPQGIEEARLNAGEEALRPVHHREADGAPVLSDRHPDWVTWTGRTHFNTTISPDRLGKPYPEPYPQSHGWVGRDNEHWSSLSLASAYLLTCSPSLRYELDNDANLYLAGHTLPSLKPNWATNGIFASRGVGRVSLSMAWNYLVTGRTDVRDRLAGRMREVLWPMAQLNQVTGPIRTITIAGPDPRTLGIWVWKPWEESLAVLGLEAAYRVTGEPAARQAAATAARTVVEFGWKLTQTETIIATAIAWRSNGAALSLMEYEDPTLVLWSYGTGFDVWGLSCIKLAELYGKVYNDPNLERQASYIEGQLAPNRTAPRNGGWDRYSEWEAGH